MDEDRLSPQLGRLIDSAKAVALQVDSGASRAEGVALLTEKQTVFVGYAGEDPERPHVSPAETALEAARRAGDGSIAAAAIAVANDPGATIYPSEASRRCLETVNPDLPVVVKQRGRWVMLLLSQIDVRD